jgi:diguanylate cyclase (GGDEF)-like protein/PAS domain S-box-containing protein
MKMLGKYYDEMIDFATIENGYTYWVFNNSSKEVFNEEGWKSILGYDSHEIESSYKEWVNRIHPEDKYKFSEQLFEDLIKDKFNIRYRIKNKQGDYINVLTRTKVVLRDEKRNPLWVVGTHEDITEQVEVENNLQTTENRFKLLCNYMSEALALYEIILDDKGVPVNYRYIDLNSSFESLASVKKEDVIGKTVLELFPDVEPKWIREYGEVALTGNPKKIEGYTKSLNKYVEVFVYSPQKYQFATLVSDFTEIRKNEDKLQNYAFYDSLTDLPNRINVEAKLNVIINNVTSNNTRGSVLFIDLDNFKNLNDTLGHNFGDKVIKKIGEILKSICYEDIIPARVGGDEFVVIIPKFEKISEVVEFTKKVLKSFEEVRSVNDNDINLSSSIGISIFPDHGLNASQILKNADLAVHHVKKSGKNNYRFYNEIMTKEIENRVEIERYLKKAIEKDELVLNYQPLIDSYTKKIDSIEALVRWMHPKIGMISPLVFIPIAEETGFIKELGTWVLKTACKQNKIWQDKGFPPMKVSINVSPLQLEQDDFIAIVKNTLIQTQLEPKYLQLEITENVSMKFLDENVKILEELRTMGINIAMDDFGTGYSSLNYLMRLPIDSLKIDKSFIEDIQGSNNKELIMDTIIKLAHNLNLEVIAEGVETEEQLDLLRKMDCNKIQGYLFSKPLPKEELEKLLSKTSNHIFKP